MATTSSFSRGCFVFKGTSQSTAPSPRKRARKSAKKTSVEPSKDANNTILFSKIDKTSASIRMETFKQTWEFIKKTSEKIISESHKQLLQDIQKFVNDNRDLAQSSIPTALVALGVNLPDHASFFKLLDSTLKSNVTPFVAMLSSKECPSLKHMVLKTIQKLTNDEIEEAEGDTEEENDEELVQKKPSKSKKLKNLTNLAQWYSEVTVKSPLIVIIQDLESFSSQLLQDFVLLCREYRVRNELPIQFIMGLATTAVLQQQLHHRTSVCLATKSFQSEPSVVLLNQLVEKLFMRESALKLGPRLMQQLLDGFLYHDLSLSSFMQRIHLIVMQHYIVVPVSTLSCPITELKSRVKQLNGDDLDLYRQLPSFMKFIENDRSKVSLLADDKAFRQFLISSLEDLDVYAKEFALYCRLMHSLSEGLPDALFGKTLRECYVNLLADNSSEDWNKFTRLFSLSSAYELKTRLEAALTNIKESSDASTDAATSIVLFLEQLRRLEEDSLTEENNARSEHIFVPQGKKLDKFELKAQLLATAKQAKPTSKFDEIKGEIVSWLNTDVACRIKPPSTKVFHEIFYAGSQMQPSWDIVPWIRRQIQPVPRVAITKALANPAAYLGCNCCSFNAQEVGILPTMPDICIAYKLHTECGRLINLYDWMVSFNSIHKKDEDDEGEEIEPVIQARFIRSVAQLQLLGFIQSSKRKTDHVARLTWGV